MNRGETAAGADQPAIEMKLGEAGGLSTRCLFAVATAAAGIYSRCRSITVANMKGLKWRAYNARRSRIAHLVGAQPVTIRLP